MSLDNNTTLQIQRTKDKVTLDGHAIQDILKAHIEKQTGRKVHCVVKLTRSASTDTYGAYAELQDEIATYQLEADNATIKL